MSPKLVVILTVAVPVRAGGADTEGAGDAVDVASAIGQPYGEGDIVGPSV